jgi:hypothetical protein
MDQVVDGLKARVRQVMDLILQPAAKLACCHGTFAWVALVLVRQVLG